MRSPRGYLLLECMVAGAILAISMSAIYQNLARARVDITKSANRDSANSLVVAKLDALECGSARANSGGQVSFNAELGTFPGFTGTWSMAPAGVQAATTLPVGAGGGTLSTDLWLIDATVSYVARHASSDDLRDGVADGQASITFQRLVP